MATDKPYATVCTCGAQSRIMQTSISHSDTNHLNGSVNKEKDPTANDDKGIHTFLRDAALISGSLPYRSQTFDNGITPKKPELDSPTASKRSLKSFSMKHKCKRSKSTGALYRKPRSCYDSDCSTSFDSSLESLIKHNLSTSKAMQPVLISKAKERNYLHGRSGTESMLGRCEMERIFPKGEVSIFVCTWNMNGQEPPYNLNELFLSDEMEHLADIYVIGTQESFSETTEWEICIQETIGPSHVLFHSETLGTIFLGVYIRRELIWYCSLPEDDSHSVRPGAAFKTKGAVGICFYLFGTSFLFITSHLTAHDDKLQERINDVGKIMKNLELPKELPTRKRLLKNKTPNLVHNFDYIFWFGDLNFRLTQPREQVLNWIKTQKFPIDPNMPFPFYDQLMSNMKKGLVFRGFQEASITFPPTYKFDPGTQFYDTSHKKRTPSYTDRILYKTRKSSRSILLPFSNYTNVKCSSYTSVPSFTTSDHKPVWGLYICKIRPGVDKIPLAAGLFNRSVYLEAMKRRAVHHKNGSVSSDSKPCAIQ